MWSTNRLCAKPLIRQRTGEVFKGAVVVERHNRELFEADICPRDMLRQGPEESAIPIGRHILPQHWSVALFSVQQDRRDGAPRDISKLRSLTDKGINGVALRFSERSNEGGKLRNV